MEGDVDVPDVQDLEDDLNGLGPDSDDEGQVNRVLKEVCSGAWSQDTRRQLVVSVVVLGDKMEQPYKVKVLNVAVNVLNERSKDHQTT